MIDEFVGQLQTICGDSLRAVSPFESFDFELVYFRDDLQASYSQEEIEEIYRLVITEGLSADKIGTLMGAGDQEARILIFEEVIVFMFPSDRYEGIFVSIDRESDARILEIVDAAQAALPFFDAQ